MRHFSILIFILLNLGLGVNKNYSQPASNRKFSLDLKLGVGNIIPPRFSVPTFFDLEPQSSEINTSDYPKLEMGPSIVLGLNCRYYFNDKWFFSTGLTYNHFQFRGRVGAVRSFIEFPIQKAWNTLNIPLEIGYIIPVNNNLNRLILSGGVAPSYHFLSQSSQRMGIPQLDTNEVNALQYKFRRFNTIGINYSIGVRWDFLWRDKKWLSIGLTANVAPHNPVRLEIEHYKLDHIDDFFGTIDPDKMTYRYWQKIVPHQLLLFCHIPLFSR